MGQVQVVAVLVQVTMTQMTLREQDKLKRTINRSVPNNNKFHKIVLNTLKNEFKVK